MYALTFTIIGILVVAMVAFYFLYKFLHEFERVFLWVTYGFMGFLIVFSVYLSFTAERPSPSVSHISPSPRTAGVQVEVDESNLLQE